MVSSFLWTFNNTESVKLRQKCVPRTISKKVEWTSCGSNRMLRYYCKIWLLFLEWWEYRTTHKQSQQTWRQCKSSDLNFRSLLTFRITGCCGQYRKQINRYEVNCKKAFSDSSNIILVDQCLRITVLPTTNSKITIPPPKHFYFTSGSSPGENYGHDGQLRWHGIALGNEEVQKLLVTYSKQIRKAEMYITKCGKVKELLDDMDSTEGDRATRYLKQWLGNS